MIKAIGFDLDDTLYSRKLFYKKVFKVMENSVIETNIIFDEFYKHLQLFSDIEYEKFIKREKERNEYKNDRVIKAYNEFGKDITLNEAIIFNSLYLYFKENITLRENSVNLLTYLNTKEIDLFILTNGPSEDQRRKLDYLNIKKYISEDKWFISDELNHTKPDVKIFKKVERSLGYKNKEILYIGDDFKNDIIGAKNADWDTIYLDVHNRNKISTDIKTANNFSEVINIFNQKFNY